MNNRRGMMTTLLTIGAAGAAVYGITKGIQNGTFQQMGKQVQNMMNHTGVQEVTSTFSTLQGTSGETMQAFNNSSTQ
ncbi:hypothetical protein HNQ35_001919 [Cerasibacillus quisquiliarum]|uniref:Uncharacterized protein n=1 Tax=Cerasibacillus quisquiliarum TaxID=227865 RepID=A0A511UXQ6_9BACI|nr:hypothetical protein [Cerasibacillus quisquiliarum]MBB5146710.1 hypothetical protein [Cerasibacillus quisquiliarum]GEN31410.1 hypothetical protein CQU01_16480 [Cerasibacillus quisquiliarum]